MAFTYKKYKAKANDTVWGLTHGDQKLMDEMKRYNNIKDINLIYTGKEYWVPSYANDPEPSQPSSGTSSGGGSAAAASKPGGFQPSGSLNDMNNAISGLEKNKPGSFQYSNDLSQIKDTISALEKNKPGEYQSSYAQQIQDMLNKYMNRENFSYDFNADPLYQQYKNQYMQKGQMAMMDTMANAAALTGGYGSSYATTAGSQAYQAYLTQLNDVIPELYHSAYSRYQNEGETLLNKMGLLQNMDQAEYGKYRDTVSDYLDNLKYQSGKFSDAYNREYADYQQKWQQYNSDRSYLADRYDSGYNKEYTDYQNKLNQYYTDRDFSYQKEQDALAQQNWLKEYELQKKR